MAEPNTDLPGDRLLAYLALSPSIAILILLVAVPMVTVFAMSMQHISLGELSGPFVGLRNFERVLADPAFLNALGNTFVWVFGSVAIEMALGLGIALLLNIDFRMRGIARAVILTPYLIPTVVAVLTWHYMFNDIIGVLNYLLMAVGLISQPLLWLNSTSMAMFSVILVGVWKFFPFVVIALMGILQAIPQEQYEAADIDGASALQKFWRITLPHIMPVFLLTALLRTIWTFHKFDIIYLMTGGGPIDATTTLPVLVYQQGFVDFALGRAAATAIITFAILGVLLAVYLHLMKRAEARQ
ncbi:carbohydrate ABC transporter permease [Ancylobacter mangrovi]|uniref:Sugar ABC transporter permease n=1 Tax=Ancylobacter mangrovi TaxID=2972472 RepID=A0A9X2PD24_9HYPH|nr:sugar ABC transporter permease [Ancylobacter mangrovi]MCS0494641.1 sugar ABC transporter permease [Ancylobacter mangrovi]MCS0502042.1 sugar ABC transporter permease [Ancylobacter mangrovi]